uniref:Uncharacterized protein n=1 Tax=Arundo donax TaxID=35708 RepID=A0A0A9DYW7_ARUDO
MDRRKAISDRNHQNKFFYSFSCKALKNRIYMQEKKCKTCSVKRCPDSKQLEFL